MCKHKDYERNYELSLKYTNELHDAFENDSIILDLVNKRFITVIQNY